MGRKKKQCTVDGCEKLGSSLGKRGAELKPYYSTRCSLHRHKNPRKRKRKINP